MPGFPRRAEIWLVGFPDDPKTRPALIVSPDARNEYSSSVLAIPITSNLRPAPTHVRLPAGQGGLAHESMARCENITLVQKPRLSHGPLGGPISDALIRQVERCLLIGLGLST